MKRQLILTVLFLVIGFSTAAAYQDYTVSRRYFNDGYLKIFGTNIVLKGQPEQIFKFTRWLDQILLVPKGFETLQKIADSGHELIIEHADIALISAGRPDAGADDYEPDQRLWRKCSHHLWCAHGRQRLTYGLQRQKRVDRIHGYSKFLS